MIPQLIDDPNTLAELFIMVSAYTAAALGITIIALIVIAAHDPKDTGK